MSKQILIVAASPRKGGNSDMLCEEFARGARSAGHAVEKVYVNDLDVRGCQACYACSKTGACFQGGDAEMVLDKMIAADAIVLATPVYFYSMDGQMKTLLDRMLPRYTQISGKDFYFIATAAAGKDDMEHTMDSLAGFTDCTPGATVRARIYGADAGGSGRYRRQSCFGRGLRSGFESLNSPSLNAACDLKLAPPPTMRFHA